MSLRFKLVIIVVFVALVPLAISAFTTLRLHQQAFDKKVGEIHHMSSRSGAALVERQLDNARQTILQASGSIRWAHLSEAEVDGALWLLYRQLDDILVVALLDEKGRGIGSSAYLDKASATNELSRHPLASLPALEAFAKKIPFEAAVKKGYAMGDAFLASGLDHPVIPLAMSVPGKAPGRKWVVAVGLSLASVCKEVSLMASKETEVFLVDPRDRVACRSDKGEILVLVEPALRNRGAGRNQKNFEFKDAEGEAVLATVAPVSQGFAIAVEQPRAVAFASSSEMRLRTIFWIVLGVVVAAVTGLFLGRSISGPVQRLVNSALELAKGNFDFRLQSGEKGKDEIGRLSQTFNYMSEEIKKRDAEIKEWNQELQTRVEEQTKELKDVQDQLLESQKIAAVTSLGAGVAHEINNPLTGIIGLAQIMLDKSGKDTGLERHKDLLGIIEKEALRIRDIVGTLLSFSEGYAGEEFSPVDINNTLSEIVRIVEEEFKEQKIEIEQCFVSTLPSILGNPMQLRQVFLELMKNSRVAMPQGGRIILSTSSIRNQVVKVEVKDNGKGIAPENIKQIFEPFFTTKDNWHSEGLGLTMAFRIIEEHYGSIKAESAPGQGTTMTVTLPAAKRGAHIV